MSMPDATRVDDDGTLATVRRWFDQTTRVRRQPSSAWLVAVVVCVVFQTLLVARLVFLSAAGGATAAMPGQGGGSLLIGVVAISSAAILLASPWAPGTVLWLQCGLFVAVSAMGAHDYMIFPMLFALFQVVASSAVSTVLIGGGAVVASMGLSSLLVAPGRVMSEFPGQLSTAATAAALALAARGITAWRLAGRRAAQDEIRAEELALERDQAIDRARIAAELHDSVGHDLTAIIALSEGLTGATGDPEVDEALDGVNTLARRGLDDTRRAVRALTVSPTSSDSDQEQRVQAHQWGDIATLVATVRSLGVRVSVSEAGQRPIDPAAADLGFVVVREALTNAVRHGSSRGRITITVEHTPVGSTVAIRSSAPDAVSTRHDDEGAGTGLERLSVRVTEAGGGLAYGSAEDAGMWIVEAWIPIASENVEHM